MKRTLVCMGMVMASMLVSVSSYAQTNERINGGTQKSEAKCINISLSDISQPAKCWDILKNSPKDTLQAQATFLIDKAGLVGGHQVQVGDTLDATFRVWVTNYQKASMHIDSIYRKVNYVKGAPRVVYSYSEVNLIKTLADRAWAAFRTFSAKGYEYDAKFLTAETVEQEFVIDSIPEKWVRKYGIGVYAGGSMFWNEKPEYTYNFGIQFTQKYWMIKGGVSRLWVEQNDNSKLAGQSNHEWLVDVMAYAKLPLDKYAHWQVGIGGGGTWHHYKTNSIDQEGGGFSSSGHARGFQAGVIGIYRPHCWPVQFQAEAGMRQFSDLTQNKDESKKWRPYVGVTVAANLSALLGL